MDLPYLIENTSSDHDLDVSTQIIIYREQFELRTDVQEPSEPFSTATVLRDGRDLDSAHFCEQPLKNDLPRADWWSRGLGAAPIGGRYVDCLIKRGLRSPAVLAPFGAYRSEWRMWKGREMVSEAGEFEETTAACIDEAGLCALEFGKHEIAQE